MAIKNLCIRETYKDKDGNERVAWPSIGVLIDGKNDKQYVKLYHMPGVLINVFEQKKKDASEDMEF